MLTQPWKLCLSFGGQPVGSVAGPRWPKAAIAAQVIPVQSSRRTFREGQRLTSDLATRPPAHSHSPDSNVTSTAQEGRGSRLMPCLRSTTNLPRPQLLPRFCSDVICRYYFSLVKSILLLESTRTSRLIVLGNPNKNFGIIKHFS